MDREGAVNFALMMSQMEGGCPVDYNIIIDLFLQIDITSFEGKASHGDYEELLVLVIAETYDKVDAANNVAVTNDPVSRVNTSAISLGQDTAVIVNTGSGVASPLARY
ncbi:hypothetical protein Tco_1004580 [Tanacetum coccineum]|uniref:Uncharacterized protein n=1 Tax=Tanacetum coccineum TaxID=301880 RepID=A0ABQ5FE79_9ASTR